MTSGEGTFEIRNVPVGAYSLKTWHERYGELTQPVRVRADATTTIDVAYTGDEKAPVASLRDLDIPQEDGALQARGGSSR